MSWVQKIRGRANSINVRKVLWCCGEIGLEFERVDAGNEFGVNDTPDEIDRLVGIHLAEAERLKRCSGSHSLS